MNRTNIIAIIVVVVLLGALYLVLQGGSSTTNTSSMPVTTTVSGIYSSTLSSTTVPYYNGSQYTTTPQIVNNAGSNLYAFLEFLNSSVLNSTLGPYWLEYPPQESFDGPGVVYNTTETYVAGNNSSEVSITLTQFNTTEFAYLNYNATYNQLNLFSKERNASYSSGTYFNASYAVINVSNTGYTQSLKGYQSIALISGYIVSIVAFSNDSMVTMPKMTALTKEQIKLMTGND